MLAGALGMPICFIGIRTLDSDLLRSLWMHLTFYLPVYFTCTDFRVPEHPSLQSFLEQKALHVPVWRRGLAWLGSAVASLFLLEASLTQIFAG